jgi:hypothetical protein
MYGAQRGALFGWSKEQGLMHYLSPEDPWISITWASRSLAERGAWGAVPLFGIVLH